MTCYELASTIISSLSLLATIFFGFAVFFLSKQANRIAAKSLEIKLKTTKSNVDNEEDSIKEYFLDNSFKYIKMIDKLNKDLKKLYKNKK